jgi:hypothetical protein
VSARDGSPYDLEASEGAVNPKVRVASTPNCCGLTLYLVADMGKA